LSTIDNEKAFGIDVSHHNGRIDWQQVVDSQVTFAIAKATEGNSFVDPAFDYNWVEMRRKRIVRGAYHFFRPAIDPIAQAKNFLRLVGNTIHSSDLPPVLDFEAYPTYVREEFLSIDVKERSARVKAWLDYVEDATDRVPMIYTNYSSWHEMMGNTDSFSRHPLWIAHYRVDKPSVPANNWGGKGWAFWQTTERGGIPGVEDGKESTDFNVYRDYPNDLKNRLSFTGKRALAPEISNGEMMAAVINTADELGIGSEALVKKLDFNYLVNPLANTNRFYDGAAVSDLELNSEEKETLLEQVNLVPATRSEMWGITNQKVVNAFYQAGESIGIDGWDLLLFAELTEIVDNRSAQYTGPLVGDMPGLTTAQKEEIAKLLGVGIYSTTTPSDSTDDTPVPPPVELPEENDDPVSYPYPGLTNQGMINLFYTVGKANNKDGWELVEEAHLYYLADDRQANYSGPRFEDMDALNPVYHIALAEALGVSLSEIDNSNPIPTTNIPPESSTEPYANLRNQDMVNVFYKAAGALGLSGWFLIESANIESIGEDREAIYSGPKIEEMETLSDVYQQTLLVKLEGFYDIAAAPVEEPVEGLPYLDITNQDVINAFYGAAEQFGMSGWDLVEIAELTYMSEDRYILYSGPKMEELLKLTAPQIVALTNSLLQVLAGKNDVDAIAHNFAKINEINAKTSKKKENLAYPGLVNQDVVNLFHKTAINAGQSARDWLSLAGMVEIGESRDLRYMPYQGPKVENIDGLSDEQKLLLSTTLNSLRTIAQAN
jgi:lysozyme